MSDIKTGSSPGPRLIHLVIERFKEEFPGHIIDSVYRTVSMTKGDEGSYDLYINHTFMAEVDDQNVYMWIPATHGDDGAPEKVSYSAADPKFFYHIVGTAKLIFQRYQDEADFGLNNAQYFGFNSGGD